MGDRLDLYRVGYVRQGIAHTESMKPDARAKLAERLKFWQAQLKCREGSIAGGGTQALTNFAAAKVVFCQPRVEPPAFSIVRSNFV